MKSTTSPQAFFKTLLILVSLLILPVTSFAITKENLQEAINKITLIKDKVTIDNISESGDGWIIAKAQITGLTKEPRTLEVAAGSLKNGGKLLMWQFDQLKIKNIHKSFDFFPLNEIETPNTLMSVYLGEVLPVDFTVKKLPKELKAFANKVLADDDLFQPKPNSLSISGEVDLPGGSHLSKALKTMGVTGNFVLGGSFSLSSAELYAALPQFSPPDALKNVVSGASKSRLFISATTAKRDKKTKQVTEDATFSMGSTTLLKLKLGNRKKAVDIEFDSSVALVKQGHNFGLEIAMHADDWSNALGLRHLNLEEVMVKTILSPTGTVTFGMHGNLLIDGTYDSLAVNVGIRPDTGLDPTTSLFVLKARELSLERFSKIADIIIGNFDKKGDIGKMARKGGIYHGLELDKLPETKLAGLTENQNLEVVMAGPNANDVKMGVKGLTIKAKGKLLIWGSELAESNVNMTWSTNLLQPS